MLAVPWTLAADETLITPGAELELVSDTFQFTEGPATDAKGNVFFTDQPNNRILKWDARTGAIAEWMKPAGRSNGMDFDAAGNLIACADEENELWSIAPDQTVTVLADDFRGRLLNGPNDCWVDPFGGIYFTDPLYKRPWWDRDPESQLDGRHVYYLSADRDTLVLVATGFEQPNGIVGSPDGSALYVADIGAGITYRFDVLGAGRLSEPAAHCEMGSDGMTLDERGNLYLTGDGVTVFDPGGTKILHIDVPEGWTANVTFGGSERRTLFITAGDSVYTLDMAVRGAP